MARNNGSIPTKSAAQRERMRAKRSVRRYGDHAKVGAPVRKYQTVRS